MKLGSIKIELLLTHLLVDLDLASEGEMNEEGIKAVNVKDDLNEYNKI